MNSDGPNHIAELLRADLAHFAESLWRNDEIGERRFNFFLTLTTSIIAGLAALYAAKEAAIAKDALPFVTRGALAGLLVFAIMTYLRLLQKNRVTDEHHNTLRYIRNKLARLDPAAGPYEVPQSSPRPGRWLRGGLAETVGVIAAGLSALLVYSFVSNMNGTVAIALPAGIGAALAIGLVRGAVRKDAPAQYFRASAGAVIRNGDGNVLALERADARGAWQMPQGGLEISEEPREAIDREIFEETGIPASSLTLVKCYPDLLAYELPAEMRSAKTGRGQVQHWFLFELKIPDTAIELDKGAEFVSWRWMSPEQLLASAVPFRKPLYQKLFDDFRPHLS